MLVPFDELPEYARVWIYQSSRKFSDQEVKEIEERSQSFLEQWAAHGNPLKSSYQVLHDQFLIISVDEGFNKASGCSIDASVSLVRELEKNLGLDFFDRTKVCFLKEGEVFDVPMTGIKSSIEAGRIDHQTLTFNNLVQDIQQLKENWVVPAEQSWIKRYF